MQRNPGFLKTRKIIEMATWEKTYDSIATTATARGVRPHLTFNEPNIELWVCDMVRDQIGEFKDF
jgi:hypothetical protein